VKWTMMKAWGPVAIGVILGLAAQPAVAQTDPAEALLAQRLLSLDEQLGLDANQSAAVAQIQQASFYDLALAIEELKVADGRLERLRLAREVAAIRSTTRDRMAAVLRPDQLARLDAFMAEEEQALRARMANQ
jgi:hypothetical protein